MISIEAMDLNATYPSLMQNVLVSNSTTGFSNILTVTGNLSDNNLLSIQDIHITDWQVENKTDMIAVSTVTTYDPYAILFSNMTFNDIEFVLGGNLLNFEYLLGIPVKIVDSHFKNIVGGKINVKSFTTNITNLSENLAMSNINVDNVNAQFDSFITLQTGAVVSISDSSFTNINCYEEGSVLFVGTKLTQTMIVNTLFENNTAIHGGVMYIEQKSVVSSVNCTFINNFAVEGGVVATSDNGHFIFSQSTFTNNFAIAGLVVNMFISTIDSSISNSQMTNNQFISSSTIKNEIYGE